MPDASTRFVTAATYRSAGAAHLARTRLSDAGIDAMVVDEALGGMTPFHNDSGASVKLRVPTSDLETAKDLLGEG
jgi:hypothetical protein